MLLLKEPVTQPEAEVTYDADVAAENEVELTADLCIKGTSIKEVADASVYGCHLILSQILILYIHVNAIQ